MTLRNHPNLLYQWPPGWGGAFGPYDELPMGEVGILQSVSLRDATPRDPAHLILKIAYEGNTATGTISSPDTAWLARLRDRLAGCARKPVVEIGNLEVDF